MARLDGGGPGSEPPDASPGDVRSRGRRTLGPQHRAGGPPANEHVGVGGLRFHRPARAWPLPVEPGSAVLPPVPAARQSAGGGRWQMLLPVMGSVAMVGFAFVVHSLLYLVVIGLMVVSMVGATLGAQMAGNRDERRRWAWARARYLALVDSAATGSRRASELQLAGLNGLYPGPEELFGLVKASDGTWERRRSDPDFGWVRLGLGKVRSVRPVKLGDSAPATNEPDPELASAAEQLVATSAYVPSAPVTAPLPELGVVAVVAPGPEMATNARGMVASWLSSLAVFHAPGDLRIAGLVPEQAADSWDWLKWLPHCRPLQGGEGFGRARCSVTTEPSGFADVVGDLVRSRLEQTRTATSSGTSTQATSGQGRETGWEHVVLVVDGWCPERTSPALDALMAHAARAAVSFIVLVASPEDVPSMSGATVSFADDGMLLYVESGPGGRVEARVQPDCLAPGMALQIARRLAPLRLGWGGSSAAVADSVRLCELLGAEEPAQVPATSLRLARPDVAGAGSQLRELLRVPIGRDEAGNPVELDLKEPASGGMGPHGIMVGATGSGKSELLRSITAALAARHEPSLLNLLLIDFKGGAAFAGLEPLPHVAGLVTNLAEEPGLIARVKAALAGELERRQKLLRDGGDLSSIGEYHARLSRLGKAGQAGRDEVDPFPYLVVIVDEFGELLESEPSFIEVFNAIGRMGRSLGVHLLLATQRLDEGRVRALEPHLRYRLALRTFSAAESRNILGSPAAFELPSVPGMGYLAVDGSLTRFKGAIATLVNRPGSQQRGPLATNALRPLTLHCRDACRDDSRYDCRDACRDDRHERSRVGSRAPSRGIGQGGLVAPTAATATAPASRALAIQSPVSQSPVSPSPVSQSPVSQSPVSPSPVSPSPVSESPASQSPVSQESLAEASLQAPGTELQALVQVLGSLPGAPARPIWLAPLPAALTLGTLGGKAAASPQRRSLPVLGLVDLPRAQKQEPLVWDPTGTGGNLGVAGAPQTGKSTLLVSLVLALVKRFGPDEAHFYCVDLGGGRLFALEGLPHVGAVVGPGEAEATARLLQDMRSVVAERASRRRTGTVAASKTGSKTRASKTRASKTRQTTDPAQSREPGNGGDFSDFDPCDAFGGDPDVFVVVDNVAMLRQSMPELEPELSALATTGLHQGVHVVVSANRWFDIRPQLLDALGTKLELRLGDPAETLTKREAAKGLPVDRPGRGLTREGELFQVALPSWSPIPGPDGEVVAIAEAVAEANGGRCAIRAPRVAALPESLREADVGAFSCEAGSTPADRAGGFLLGVSEFRCRPVQVDLLAPGAHLAVYGDAGSGRTTVLARALGDMSSRFGPRN